MSGSDDLVDAYKRLIDRKRCVHCDTVITKPKSIYCDDLCRQGDQDAWKAEKERTDRE